MGALIRDRGALILFGLASIFIFATLLQEAGVYDEGLIVSGAERILRGQHPYFHFNSGYPPGQFYTIALVFRVFGVSLTAERIWDSLWRLGIVVAAFWLCRELAGKHLRWVPVACCLALVGGTGYRLYPLITATLPFLCAVACALVFQRTRLQSWIFGAGLLLGVTALYRHDLAVCAGVAVLWLVWGDRRATAWLTAGVVMVVGPAAVYLLKTIPHHILWQTFIVFPKVNAAARHLPITNPPGSFVRNLLLPSVIVALTVFQVRRAPAEVRTRTIAVAALALLTTFLATQRLDAMHTFPAVLLCVILLASFSPSSLAGRFVVVIAVLLYGILPLLEWTDELRWVWNVPAAAVARAGRVRIPRAQAQAVQYIQQRLPVGEPLYVGVTSHSRISYNDALFAFLADRPQATRFDMWVPGETNTMSAQAEIVLAVDRERVRFIVLFDPRPLGEANLSAVDSGVRLLDDYLTRRYQLVAVFGRYRILERTT